MDLIHRHFRKICRMLVDMDEWGQILMANLLTRCVPEPRNSGTAELWNSGTQSPKPRAQNPKPVNPNLKPYVLSPNARDPKPEPLNP